MLYAQPGAGRIYGIQEHRSRKLVRRENKVEEQLPEKRHKNIAEVRRNQEGSTAGMASKWSPNLRLLMWYQSSVWLRCGFPGNVQHKIN